jgi:hypothetical protein
MGKEDREVRSFPVEVRVEQRDGEESPKIRGYAAVFDEWSEDLGGFREVIRRGAFKKTIKEADVRALWNHDANYVLGRTKSGSLTLGEDRTGLAIEVDPPRTQWATDLLESIRRGDVDQMSFGFRTVKDSWDDGDVNAIKRELLEVELFDVSPVTYPAYPQTSVGVREHLRSLQSEPVDDDHSDDADEPSDAGHSSTQRMRMRRLQLAEKLYINKEREHA